jgi:hypothetical protein
MENRWNGYDVHWSNVASSPFMAVTSGDPADQMRRTDSPFMVAVMDIDTGNESYKTLADRNGPLDGV